MSSLTAEKTNFFLCNIVKREKVVLTDTEANCRLNSNKIL